MSTVAFPYRFSARLHTARDPYLLQVDADRTVGLVVDGALITVAAVETLVALGGDTPRGWLLAKCVHEVVTRTNQVSLPSVADYLTMHVKQRVALATTTAGAEARSAPLWLRWALTADPDVRVRRRWARLIPDNDPAHEEMALMLAEDTDPNVRELLLGDLAIADVYSEFNLMTSPDAEMTPTLARTDKRMFGPRYAAMLTTHHWPTISVIAANLKVPDPQTSPDWKPVFA